MHQHPRPPPRTASPATSEQSNPTRTNNPRDRDVQQLRSTSTQGSGSSEDFANTKQETSVDNPVAQMQRLNQVIQNFHTKAALIILHSRVELPEAISAKNNEKRVNRWFNIELPETEEYSDEIRKWRKCDLKTDRPPPLVIEVYLAVDALPQGQRLVLFDEDEKRSDVRAILDSKGDGRARRRSEQTTEVLLERWTIELGESGSSVPSDLTSVLPLVYKKSIVLFRSLYTYCNFLPTWKLSKKVGRSRSNMAMRLGYRILDGSRLDDEARSDNLDTPLTDSTADVTTTYKFGETESPAGPFSVSVRYRENCDFRIDDSEEWLSSRFLVAEEEMFQPSLPNEERTEAARDTQKVGSLPNDRRQHLMQRPELGHAYGSMSTFHQAGFSAGTSPISALRSARELGQPSPSPEQTRQPQQVASTQSQRPPARIPTTGRRTSFSFQPFKAPALSASPLSASPLSSSPRTSSTRVPVLGSLAEESHLPPPNAQAIAARKSGSNTSDNPTPSSISSSPKPAPVRYSSSFSHRRARLSSGGTTTRTDDDQISSGKASTTSSTARPGSELTTEAAGGGGSSGSMQEDDENIAGFLSMLDAKKDLLGVSGAAKKDMAAQRTVTALNRFHRMRDSNAALSDSMSSSLMLQRSSATSSRTSGAPPIIAPTAISTSSSPGKPLSPHTPHTPFAPSRLSAAYSHEDHDDHEQRTVEDEQPDDETLSDDTTQARSGAHIPAIDIPNSPRPFHTNYRRSSSAQRRPLSSDDDIGDIFGMRSASMGAQDTKPPRTQSTRPESHSSLNPEGPLKQKPSISPRRSSPANIQTQLAAQGNDGVSDSGSGRSSTHVYRSRLTRGGALRSGTNVTPPQGSTSSFGGTTGGSIERAGDSGGSISGSWARGGRFRSGSRPDNKFGDDDDFLPFAMEKSDFNTPAEGRDVSRSER